MTPAPDALPPLPTVCAVCWFHHGRLVPADGGYLSGDSLCMPHREEREDDLAARWDEIAARIGDV